MNALEEYLKILDDSTYDCEDIHTINSEFQQIHKKLNEDGEHELARLSDLNRQVFSVQKSFDYHKDIENGIVNGLSWKMSGTQTLEDGKQVPIYWPDVRKYTKEDFEYFEKRYNEAKNLYVKLEYGLLVYFGKKTAASKHNDFKRKLSNELFQLSNEYFDKVFKSEKRINYLKHFTRALKNALKIAEKSKFETEYTSIIKYAYQTHQEWNTKEEGTLHLLLDLSGLLLDVYNLSSKIISFGEVVDKNLEGAKDFENKDLYGAISIIDQNIAIAERRSLSKVELLNRKAELYFKLAKDAEKNDNRACVRFAENALRIYQSIKNDEEAERLKRYYAELRGKYSLTEFRQEIPQEYLTEMDDRISKAVSENDENGIIHHFINTPWYDSIPNIKKRSEELRKQTVLLSILPTSILDKFGNTVDLFHSDEEKKTYSFWNSYTYSFQLGTQTMHKFFIEAYKAKKLTYNSVISFLENTWYSEPIIRRYHGEEIEVKPIDTLKPGLKSIFKELDKFFSDNTYECDFVTITDSLTLKIEGLFRYFFEKVEMPTFKPTRKKKKGSNKIVMEKSLDELLADIAHEPPMKPEQKTNFDEEDRIFIKYVLTEKVGLNLRNDVAHGLMDIYEYSFENVVVLFCIIIKLSKYKFLLNEGETNENNNK